MDNDSFIEITSENWFSRIGDSIKGILFGIILFIAAFPLLWWNEGNSVKTYNSLKEGLGTVVSISSDKVDPANNGKLVHIQGLAKTEEILHDTIFGVSATAIKLIRNVSMYQWKEDVKTETKEKVGGTKETKKTYNYSKDWSSSEISSSNFKRAWGHNNPSMLYKRKTMQAQQVMLGSFKLTSSQVGKIGGATSLSMHNVEAPAMLGNKKVTLAGDSFYLGSNPSNPQIGDMKISFQVVNPTNVSLIYQQQGNSFTPYKTSNGKEIKLFKTGLADAKTMFSDAQAENTMMTWAIRIGGTLMMWIGLGMVFKPLSILGSILPFLGNLISMGTSILAFLITLPCAMITIALAWIAYRPLLAGGLITVAILAIVAMKFMPRKSMAPSQA